MSEPAPPPPPAAGRPAEAPEFIELGRVVGVFGFRGELKLHLDNPKSDLLDAPFPVVLEAPDGQRRTGRMSARKGAGKRILGRFEGVDDEGGASALHGWRVLARTADLPETDDGELYVWQLEDAEVVCGGAVVGRVVAVQSSGPVAILEIDAGGREVHLVPLAAGFVVEAAPGRVVLTADALEE